MSVDGEDGQALLAPVMKEVRRLSSLAFVEHLEGIADRVTAEFGGLSAAQHLRNVLRAVSFSQGPVDLLDLHAATAVLPIERLRRTPALINDALAVALQRVVPPATRRADPVIRRILLVGSDVPTHARAPHMRQYCAYAGALAMLESTEAVRLLITQEYAPEGPRITSGELGPERMDELASEVALLAGLQAADKVSFSTPAREGPVRPYLKAINQALDFDPDLIVAFQGVYGSEVLPPLLRDHAPLAAIQMNRANPEPAGFDLILAQGKRDSFDEMPTPRIWRNHVVPAIALPKTEELDASALGPTARLRVVSAIGQGRLEKALMINGGYILGLVLDFLTRQPDATWLMLGTVQPTPVLEAARARDAAAAERLVMMPRVNDVRAIYAHCQVYMHPHGDPGGGMATAMAVAEGLAVIVPSTSDSTNYLPPHASTQTAPEAFARLSRMAADPLFRQRQATAQRQYMERRNSLERAARVMGRLLPHAYRGYSRRSAGLGPVDGL